LLPYGYKSGYSSAMARKQPPGWPSEAEQVAANERATATVDAMASEDPAPLPHPLTGPFVRLGQHDPPVALQLGLDPEGRLICTGLLVGWQLDAIGDASKVPMSDRTELTARALRRVKLPPILSDLGPHSVAPLPNWLHQTIPVVRHPGPKGHSNEHYKMVAELHRTALVTQPASPMKWLAKQLGCADATAYRWLDEAAVRGFLPQRKKIRRGGRPAGGPPPKPRQKGGSK
jgi:hypothetical protein